MYCSEYKYLSTKYDANGEVEYFLIYVELYGSTVSEFPPPSNALNIDDFPEAYDPLLVKFSPGSVLYYVTDQKLYIADIDNTFVEQDFKEGSSDLPPVTGSDNGDVLGVVSGAWAKSGLKTINSQSLLGSGNIDVSGLPAVTSTDNGKLLGVSSGQWTKVDGFPSISGADEGKAFSVSGGVAGWNSEAVPAVPTSISIAAILKANDLGDLSWENAPYVVDAADIVASDGTTTLNAAINTQLGSWLAAATDAPGTFTAVQGLYDFDSAGANLNGALSRILNAIKPLLVINFGVIHLIAVPNLISIINVGLTGMYFHVGGTLPVGNTLYYVNGDIWVTVTEVGISGFVMPTTMIQAPTLSGTYNSGTNTLNITGGA